MEQPSDALASRLGRLGISPQAAGAAMRRHLGAIARDLPIFDSAIVDACLRDGRLISTPLWWYPRLLSATPAQRNHVDLMLSGVHWPDLDEDLSVRGMLMGCKAPGATEPVASAA